MRFSNPRLLRIFRTWCDHEIPAFLSGVVAALRQLFPGCLRKTVDLLRISGSVPLSIWKSALVDDLELLEGTPLILTLDDYHRLAAMI